MGKREGERERSRERVGERQRERRFGIGNGRDMDKVFVEYILIIDFYREGGRKRERETERETGEKKERERKKLQRKETLKKWQILNLDTSFSYFFVAK